MDLEQHKEVQGVYFYGPTLGAKSQWQASSIESVYK